jgi:hypothetical protein
MTTSAERGSPFGLATPVAGAAIHQRLLNLDQGPAVVGP